MRTSFIRYTSPLPAGAADAAVWPGRGAGGVVAGVATGRELAAAAEGLAPAGMGGGASGTLAATLSVKLRSIWSKAPFSLVKSAFGADVIIT
jgi:hypothetical protein